VKKKGIFIHENKILNRIFVPLFSLFACVYPLSLFATLAPPSLPISPSTPTSSVVPASLVSLGDLNPGYALIVEKKTNTLKVMQALPDGRYDVIKSYRAITGKQWGDKQVAGDKRTPEGIYFIVGQNDRSTLEKQFGDAAKKYGPKAFVLDYPNIFDKRMNKTGYGIWIHGVENDQRISTPFDTEGCVALMNADVVDISHYISMYDTPVVIQEETKMESPQGLQEAKKDVLNEIQNWKEAWEGSDFKNYMSHYSKNFISLGRDKKEWEQYKKILSQQRQSSIEVNIGMPKILAFKDQVLVQFLQSYKSTERSDFGRKFLYLKKEENQYKIIAEKWIGIDHPSPQELAAVAKSPLSAKNY
jgi:murein L,D-transpeptidase YafK